MLHVDSIDLFYGASQALKSVGLTAEKGRVTCVLGRNGVGKTSLMRAICGQQAVRTGRILWEDEDITAMPPMPGLDAASPSYRRAARFSRCSPFSRI